MARRADALAALVLAALGAAVSNVHADGPGRETPVWKELQPSAHPTNASHLVYEVANSRILSVRADGEVWALGPATWTQLTTALAGGFFGDQPGVAFDVARGEIVVATELGDTWAWSGGSWRMAASGGGPPGNVGACGPRLVFDEGRGAIVALTPPPNDASSEAMQTYAWDGANATWKLLPSANPPPGRSQFGAVYDRRRKRAVVFGGYVAGRVSTDETWEWDGAAWFQLTPIVRPTPREIVQIAFDAARGRAIFFAGQSSPDDPVPHNDTWEWDGASWAQLLGGPVPFPRHQGAIAYDESRRRTILFGGGGGNDLAENDTWEYSTYNGACASADACDTARCDGARCCYVACDVCQVCDDTGAGCALVRSADDPDSCTGAQTCDASGQCKRKAGQACANDDGCASGLCAGGACCAADCGAFGCDANGACRRNCASDGDCATGAYCENATCALPSASCASGHTSQAITTGAIHDCTPYLCSAHDGLCRTSCETSDDCSDGFSCNGAGACVTPRLAGPGGCSAARAAPRRGPSVFSVFVVAAAAFVVRLRRRAR